MFQGPSPILEKSSHLQKETTQFFDGMNQCVKEKHQKKLEMCAKNTSEASKFPG